MGQIRLGQPVNRRLGDLLVAEGLVKQDELQRALAEQKGTTEKLGSVLVRLKLVNEEQLTGFLSRQYGIPSITLSQLDIDPGILRLVPPQIAKKYEVLPVKRAANTLTLAMADPTNVFALDDVSFMTNLQVLPVVASQAAIRRAIERNYENQGAAITDVLTEVAEAQASNVEVLEDDEDSGGKVDVFELKESADEAPVVKLVNMVLVDAIQKGASDIHWEPYEKAFRVRFRIDGVLHEMLAPPKRLESAIISRLKIMSNLDIAERRLPQDGRIKLRYSARDRLPGVGAAHDLRREGRPPHPRQGCAAARPDQARLRSGGARAVREGDPSALRDGPDHGADGLGQDDDALLGDPHDQLTRAQYYDGRRSCRIQPEGS